MLRKTPIEQQMEREGYHYSNLSETGKEYVHRRKSQLKEEMRSKRRTSQISNLRRKAQQESQRKSKKKTPNQKREQDEEQICNQKQAPDQAMEVVQNQQNLVLPVVRKLER